MFICNKRRRILGKNVFLNKNNYIKYWINLELLLPNQLTLSEQNLCLALSLCTSNIKSHFAKYQCNCIRIYTKILDHYTMPFKIEKKTR